MATTRGHGEGTLYHNVRKGLWIAKVSLPDGRRLERSSQDERVAKGYLREMLRLVGKGVTPKSRLTVAAFLADWLADMQLTVRPQTWRRYESVVRVHLTPGLGSLALQALRPSVVERFLATKQGRTAQLCREVLRNALNAAQRDRLAEYNAAELARPVRHDAKPTVILAPDDLRRLLEGTASDRLAALYTLAATTGMREGELLGLGWDDVDLEAGVLTVRSQLVRLPHEWVLDEPKTRKGHRTIRLPAMTVAALRTHRIRHAAERRPDWPYWKLVFVTPDGTPLYGYRVVQELRGHLARLGITTARPLKLHELRHGLASLLKDGGVSDEALTAYFGWSTTRMVERYAHALDGSSDAVARVTEARLG